MEPSRQWHLDFWKAGTYRKPANEAEERNLTFQIDSAIVIGDERHLIQSAI